MRSFYEFKPDDAYDFARHVGIQARAHGDELMFRTCPYCKPKPTKGNIQTFSINLKTGQFKCLRASCGVTGNMITLSRDFDFSLGNEIDEYYRPKKEYRRLKTPKEPIKPKDPAIKYLESRGISEEVARRYEITTQTNRDNILVFPFYDENEKLQFVKYRKTDFDPEKDKNKEWCEANCKPILFGMKQCNDKFDRLIVTEGQCFDNDAEVMTPNGWKKLENYAGEMVLQVNQDLTAEFITPSRYIAKRHTGNMHSISIGGNYYTSVTNDHNIVLQKQNGDIIKKRIDEKISTNYHIPTTVYHFGSGLEWPNDLIALCIAISADGTLDYRANGNVYARFGLTKQRKVDRLLGILSRLNLKFSDSILRENKKEYHSICFTVPKEIKSKYLPWEFATKTTFEQKKFIIEEMVHWDGNYVNGRRQYEYMSIIKHNADVVQAVSSMCGYMSTVRKKESGGNGKFKKGYIWKVTILLGKKNVSTQQFEKNRKVKSVDQMVYCVTVPSGMILVRQQNKISVSGNCDSLSVATAGIENAVSVPTGAKGMTWVPYCYEWVSRFDEIIVFGDHEKGMITLLDDMNRRFPGKIKHVREEDYLGCKDANEILQKHGAVAVKQAVENAIPMPVNRVLRLSEVKSVNIYKLPKLKTGINELDKTLYGGLPFGMVCLISGKRGDGKSTFASQIIANAIDQGYVTFTYSGEMPNYLYKNWFDFQIAGRNHIIENTTEFGTPDRFITNKNQELINAWYRDKAYIYDSRIVEVDEREDLLKTVRKCVMQYGVKVILIDNLMTAMYIDERVGTDKYEAQGMFVRKLANMAVQMDLLILLVAHKRKNSFGGDENDEVSGSGDITNLAGITLGYDRGSRKEIEDEVMDETQRKLIISKNRLFGKINTKGIILNYDEKSKRIYGNGDDVNRTFGWDNSGGFVNGSGMEIPFD